MARTPSDTSGATRVGDRPLASLPERELVERCNTGERAAHDELYHRFRRVVAANLFRALGDRQELDDLVQEVFVIAYRGLANFRHEAQLATWLYRICVNVSYGRMRTRGRRPPPLFVDDLEQLANQSSATERPESPERALERRQDQARVYATLARLPAKKRIVLYLHEIEGRDLKDIAELIDSNPVTVRTRLFYARREFYKLLAEDDAAAGGEGTS
ncbi:MAG: sigma-70 family RNA polymerase sigma factor [Kofleriaceae bacterium]